MNGVRWALLAACAAVLVGLPLAQAGEVGLPDAQDDVDRSAVEAVEQRLDATVQTVDDLTDGSDDQDRGPRSDGGSDDGDSGTGDDQDGREGRASPVPAPVQNAAQRVEEGTRPLAGQAQELAEDPVDALQQTVIAPVQATANELEQEVQQVLAPEEDEATTAAARPQAAAPEPTEGVSTPLLLVASAAAATAGIAVGFWLAGSSGTATATTEGMRRLLPGASPLFTRFEKGTVLGHPKREALYAAIMESPGITLQDLCGRANLSRTAVTHHLRLMEQQHLVVSKRVGRSRHFFENGGRYGRGQKEALALLRNDRSREVARFIQAHPGAIQKSICEALGIQASVAHWHVRRLQEASVVDSVRQGRTVSYYPSGAVPA